MSKQDSTRAVYDRPAKMAGVREPESPGSLSPPLAKEGALAAWSVGPRELKRYPHFDKFLPAKEIEAIVLNPDRVKTNKFFPFLLYEKQFQPFRLNGKPKKTRLIRNASRRDSNIFSYYRYLLSQPYEAELRRLKLDQN